MNAITQEGKTRVKKDVQALIETVFRAIVGVRDNVKRRERDSVSHRRGFWKDGNQHD